MRERKGFTLIELLVAILVVAFILAILVVIFQRPLGMLYYGSQVEKVQRDAKQILDAWKLAYFKDGKVLRTVDELVAQGYLVERPTPPAGVKDPNVDQPFEYVIDPWFFPGPRQWYVPVYLHGVRGDFCTVLNEVKSRTDNYNTVSCWEGYYGPGTYSVVYSEELVS